MFLNNLAILSLSACLPMVISAPVLDSNNTTTATSVSTSQNATSTISPFSNLPLSFGVDVGHSPSGSEAVFVYSPQSPETVSSETDSPPQRPLVMAYYPSWADDEYSPDKINYTLYDWIDFAFAIPDCNFDLTWDSEAPDLLARLVKAARAGGTKVKLSIGGWTGSHCFSGAVSDETSRNAFVSNIVGLYNKYNLDGIDIDWEYPGRRGESDNQVSLSDSANFLQFLRLLRKSLPANAVVTAAVDHMPFVDDDGARMKDVSDFAEVLDWILIMNYDVWSASPNPGPNAPLSDKCGNSTQPHANAQAALNAWTMAGFKLSQIVLGIPAYGILSTSNATGLRTRSKRGSPALAADDDQKQGEIQFRSLVDQGALSIRNDTSGQRYFVASPGFTRDWDQCSSTPFLRSLDANQIVSYDDPESIGLKAKFVMENGMRGTSMWEMTGDTEYNDLTNAVRTMFGC
ncbi:glycoside hydrolase family 18 protein [Desarmillaria tabescens]|uniref:Glycoside hydrolase family 18 protein n=1 Tax=Armillaria tabescens TaxID=1929756 RepID=A0AA39NM33_ARMTA|nr:glycoside hydrolase family 18 protein [Desarmillaria tabescens]KAK0468166.1 glycoside hydrolase family 18 protein [Desarmillaria tabescens]